LTRPWRGTEHAEVLDPLAQDVGGEEARSENGRVGHDDDLVGGAGGEQAIARGVVLHRDVWAALERARFRIREVERQAYPRPDDRAPALELWPEAVEEETARTHVGAGDNHEVVAIGELPLSGSGRASERDRRPAAVHRNRALAAERSVDVDARGRQPRKQLALEDPGQ
jgi:hypothetical protein